RQCFIYYLFFTYPPPSYTTTLPLHDALPILIKVLSPGLAADISAERFIREMRVASQLQQANIVPVFATGVAAGLPYYSMGGPPRSEEHTSELQSPCNLVCRLLLEKKKRQLLSVPDGLETVSIDVEIDEVIPSGVHAALPNGQMVLGHQHVDVKPFTRHTPVGAPNF